MSLRVGLLGFGGAGRAHYSYFSCQPDCRVTRAYDPDPASRQRATWLCGSAVETTGDLPAFWDGLDAVSVCTPDSTHADYIVEALARGMHVLCEKPLTDSYDGLRRIHAAAAASERVVAVLHQMRFVPLHARIKQFLEAGRLGRMSYLEGYYVHDLRERAFAHSDWRSRDCATPLVYSGCHFVDLLRWFAGGEIVEVSAQANHLGFPGYPESDLNLVSLRFDSGVLGKVLVAFGAAGPQDHSVRLYGDRACIENNVWFEGERWGGLLHRPLLVQRRLLGDPVRSNRHGLLAQLRRNVPAWLLGRSYELLRWLARRPGAEYGACRYPMRLYEHALACVLGIEDFLAAVRGERAPLCTVDESARTVLACLAGVESYRRGGAVQRVQTLEQLC